MQLGQAVGLAAVVVPGSDGGQHGRQVVCGDARQAHFGQIGCAQRRAGGLACGHALDRVGDAGELVDLGHRVHIGRLRGAHDVVEQCQVLGIGSGCANVGTNGCVLRSRRVHRGRGVGCGVARCTGGVVGFAQNGVVGVNDGLHFGSGVGLRAPHGCAVERVVDGRQVAVRHATDACIGVGLRGRGAGAGVVGACCAADVAERLLVAGHCSADHVGQFLLACNRRAVAVGCVDGLLHRLEGVCADSGCTQGGAATCGRLACHQCVDLSGRGCSVG